METEYISIKIMQICRLFYFKNYIHPPEDCVLDEEGLVWSSVNLYAKRINDKTFKISPAIFAWGQKQYDVLIRTSPGL